MSFGYHNHTLEFGTGAGRHLYDELLRLTDPKFVCFEMDCGWVHAAGRNPVDYIKKSPSASRSPREDVAKLASGEFQSSILGMGTLDYRPISTPPPASNTTSSSRKSSTATSSNPSASTPNTCASSTSSAGSLEYTCGQPGTRNLNRHPAVYVPAQKNSLNDFRIHWSQSGR